MTNITSGSMLIPNYLGQKTLLTVDTEQARADNDNAISDTRAALKREKGSSSVRSGNVTFLDSWIRLYEKNQADKDKIINKNIPPVVLNPLLNPSTQSQEVQFGKLTQGPVMNQDLYNQIPEENLEYPGVTSQQKEEVQFGKPSWER